MEKLGQNNIYSQFFGQYPILRTYKGDELINEYVPLYTPPVDWSDIRVDCPANSIALYAGHERLEQIDYIITNDRLLWANPKIYLNSASTGINQRYINTGYVPNQKTNITIKTSCAGSSSGIYVPFGQRTEGAYNTSTEQVYLNFAANITMFYGQNKTTSAWETDTAYTLNYTDARTNTSSEYPIYLFNINNKGTNANGYYGNIYFVKFFDENNNLLHHYVPVPQGLEIGEFTCPSNGMFDIVNQQFYGNAGTGTFTYGGANPSNLNIKTSVQYDNLGFTASCIGGYNVFIDGTQYGSTYANGSQCNITWSTSGITTGDYITTPTALKAHKIWIEPATEGNNITAFRCNRVAASGTEEQGVLWGHFNLTNAINIVGLFAYPSATNNFRNHLLKVFTAKNNLVVYKVASAGFQSGFYSSFNDCNILEYLPILKAESQEYASGTYLSLKNVPAKKVVIKNNNGTETFALINNSKVEEISVENGLTLASSASAETDARGATNLKKFPKINQNKGDTFQMFNCPNLEPVNIDDRFNDIRKVFRFYGTQSVPTPALKSLRVSNEAPFDGASPQIRVDYTGLDRSALVQLFNDLPYNVGYEVVGSPTISSGVVSGFTTTDYAYCSIPFIDNGQDLELAFSFNANSVAYNRPIVGVSNNYNAQRPFLALANQNGTVRFRIASGLNLDSSYLISAGVDYKAIITRANNIYTLKLYSGNTLLDTQSLTSETLIGNGASNTFAFGFDKSNYNQAFNGSIDLNNTYIKINGVSWFGGKPARVNKPELTIVGCTGTADLSQDDRDIAENEKNWKLNY